MGRVYDALKRAAEAKATNGANGTNGAKARGGDSSPSRRGKNGGAPAAAKRNGAHTAAGDAPVADTAPEFLLESAAHFKAPETAHASASTGHTGLPVGSALPGGQAPREAGATLGAAGSARTPDFFTVEISAARVEPHLVAITSPRSAHAERYRSLRTRVLHAGERKKMQAFVITSAGIMEGKTLTALNLSWLLAQTDGVRALLIDGDLRNPSADDYLGIEAPVGLSEVLAGEATLEETILRLEPAGLYLLPGGSVRDDVAEMLSGPKFSAVLAAARRMFDYIIIDAPPLSIFTDATMLISRADSALIVARANKTRYAELERVLEPVARERLLGVVLNCSDEVLNESNYYYTRRRYKRQDEAATAAAGGHDEPAGKE